MKRKRSPSPASQRPTSRSPLSPRSTRASTTSPAAPQLNGVRGKSADTSNNDEDNNVNGFNIRRSSRARRLSYPIFNSNFMTQDDVIRNRGLIKQQEAEQRIAQQPPRSRSTTPDTEDSPFLHHHSHVRFSPSAKPGSPARISRRQRQAASIAKMRLQNVPSEDEQSEFNRRYSRDLRSRRRQETTNVQTDNLTSTPISTRRTTRFQEPESEKPASSDIEDNQIASDNDDSIVRSTGTRKEKNEAANEADDEDEPLGRRLRKPPAKEMATISASSEPTTVIRRSLRKPVTPTTAKQTSSEQEADHDDNSEEGEEEPEEEEEDEDDKAELSSTTRPRRRTAPVERFGYEPPSASPPRYNGRHSRRHHHRRDNDNIDKYSSNEEFQGKSSDDDHPRRSRKKYNMRSKTTQRKKIISYRSRDTSSSSSNESVDEQRFAKRKNKRMMVERSKLRPVNLSKQDATKAIFRERKSVGASMADIQPMEMDMGVTFESVGGVDDHINSLREMVIFPLLYPEIFTKFSMTPPRGVLFYGPPGTGKTLIARALASECSSEGRKVAFFMRKGADCLSKWIGESERQLRLLFDQAYLMRPSIIFFDEIDGLAPVRSSRNDQIHSSIVSTLLALMDGLDNRGEIIVIGATNRIENIDPALRRPGRFDRELRFGLPTRDSRKAILSLHTKSWQPCVDENMINLLADKTIGYSGADLKGLCVEATLNALRRRYPQVYQTSQKLALDFDQIQIKEGDFCQAMDKLVPSTHRIQDQSQSPLVPRLRPLLGSVLDQLCGKLDDVNRGHEFSYRPRLCIRGGPGQCLSTYLGPAVLHHLEKLPCHKLDIPSLFSNSARSPEEAMFHIIHEAKRTVPSVLYIPHIMRLWKKVLSFAQREAFLAMMSEIQPKAPLIVIAFTEDKQDEFDDEIDTENGDILAQMFDPETEVIEVENANDQQRREYFKPIFDASTQPPEEDVRDEEPVEILTVLPIPESRELTEKEEKRLRRKEDGLLRELRIFLRDTWLKINREQKFFMFRTPVDTEEIYDYLEYVEKPMDFDLMLTKLDNAEYRCAQDFLDDIDLIANNALKYNSDLQYETNKVICHRARALQDFAYALLKAEMDTDFEDNCKEIISRRKKLTEKLNKPTTLQGFDPKTKSVVPLASTANAVPGSKPSDSSADPTTSKQPPKKKKRKSRWSSGLPDKKRSKRVPKRDENVEVDENPSVETSMEKSKDDSKLDQDDTFENEESDSDEEVTLNESKEMKIDFKKLKAIEDDLVKRTEDFHIENLERIFTKLMECVSHYRNVYDRSQLPQDLTDKMKTLKLLPLKKKS